MKFRFNIILFSLSAIIIFAQLFPNLCFAQNLDADTLKLTHRESIILRDSCPQAEKFDARQLIVPSALMFAGALGAIDSDNNLNKSVQDAMTDLSDGRRCKVDDYLRFLPSATHLLLGFTGVKAKHSFKERFLMSATSHAAMLIMGYGTKYITKEQRPDLSDKHSFPSGHVAMAFTGAELMRMEYGTYWGLAGYASATAVAFFRLYNNRHWFNDVLMGAGIGILSAKIGQWLLPFERKLFKMSTKSSQSSTIAAIPVYDPNQRAVMLSLNAIF